jgi:hypothetical protein
MRGFIAVASLAVLLASGTFVTAEPTKRESSGLEFDLPKKWVVQEAKDSYLVLAPEKAVAIILVELKGVKAEDLKELKTKKAMTEFMKAMNTFKDVEFEDDGVPEEEEYNDLKHTSFSGTGKMKAGPKKDAEMEWSVTIVEGAKIPTLFVTFGTPDDMEKHADDTEAFFDSIRKLGTKLKKKEK